MDKKERIILAALEEFVERGFAGARIRSICQDAEVNLAAVSYYFGGKESLYKAVLNYSFSLPDPFDGMKEDIAADADPEKVLLNWIILFLKNSSSASPLYRFRYRLIMREMLSPSKLFPPLFTSGIGARFEILKQVVGKVRGLALDDPDLTVATLLVLAQCLFFFNKPAVGSITGEIDFGMSHAESIGAMIVSGITSQANHGEK